MFFPRRTALVLLGAAMALPAPGGAVEPGLAGGLRKLGSKTSTDSSSDDEVSFTSDPNIKGYFLKSGLEDAITGKLQECVDAYDGEDPVECDVYFNPHTLYSYYRNPSAVGVQRGQLYYDGKTRGQSKINGVKYIFDVPEATSEIIDDLMISTGLQSGGGATGNCDTVPGTPYTPLGSGIARAENVRVSWQKTETSNVITLLSSTIILKDAETEDIRCTYCTDMGAGNPPCPSALDDTVYSNLILLGSHLHTGDSMMDGPPPVFFCKNAPGGVLSPGAPGIADTPICSDVYN